LNHIRQLQKFLKTKGHVLSSYSRLFVVLLTSSFFSLASTLSTSCCSISSSTELGSGAAEDFDWVIVRAAAAVAANAHVAALLVGACVGCVLSVLPLLLVVLLSLR
jgi:hypothetical protein